MTIMGLNTHAAGSTDCECECSSVAEVGLGRAHRAGHGRLAICAVTAALLRGGTDTQAPAPARPDNVPPAEFGMIPLTIPETGRLLSRPPRLGVPGHWLAWRRHHQGTPTPGTTSDCDLPTAPRSSWPASEWRLP